MNKRLVRFTKWLLDAMFYGGMVITLGFRDIPLCGKIYTIFQGALYTPVRALYRFRNPGPYDRAGT